MLERGQAQIQVAMVMVQDIQPSIGQVDLAIAKVYPRLKGKCLGLVIGQERQEQLGVQFRNLRNKLSSEGIELSRRQLVMSYLYTDVGPEITKSADEYFDRAVQQGRKREGYPVTNILAFCSCAFIYHGLNFALTRLSVAEDMFNSSTQQARYRQLNEAIQQLEQRKGFTADHVLSDAVVGLGLLKEDPTGVSLLKEVVKDASGKPSRYPVQLPYFQELQRSVAKGTSLALEIYGRVYPLTAS